LQGNIAFIGLLCNTGERARIAPPQIAKGAEEEALSAIPEGRILIRYCRFPEELGSPVPFSSNMNEFNLRQD
jgi:hypothetical protein